LKTYAEKSTFIGEYKKVSRITSEASVAIKPVIITPLVNARLMHHGERPLQHTIRDGVACLLRFMRTCVRQ